MYDEGARRRGDSREERARRHPVRAAILALLDGEGDGLTAQQVRDRLPDDRPLAALAYHLRVLVGVDLVRAGDGNAPRYTLAA